MRQANFNIQTVKDKVWGSVFYRIYVPAYLNPSGRRGYFYYHTKEEARAARGEFIASTRTESRVQSLSGAQQIDAQRALESLAEAGLQEMTLTQAVRLALPMLKATAAHVVVNDFLTEFATVKGERWGALSARNFATVSKAFLLEFSGRALASITAPDLQRWLDAKYTSAASRAFAIRTLRPAWSYAVRQGKLADSPWGRLEPEKVQAKDAIDIYTPDEARRLLECAPDDCRPAFALLLFAGIRPAELTRLVWGDVRDGVVHIRPSVAKTRQVRNVPIEPALAAFLAQPGAQDAKIIPASWRVRFDRVRREAGLTGRPDAARHSYATYFLAAGGGVDALKAAMGHSRGSDVLFAHYRAAATPAQAAEFWGIRPTASQSSQ